MDQVHTYYAHNNNNNIHGAHDNFVRPTCYVREKLRSVVSPFSVARHISRQRMRFTWHGNGIWHTREISIDFPLGYTLAPWMMWDMVHRCLYILSIYSRALHINARFDFRDSLRAEHRVTAKHCVQDIMRECNTCHLAF